MRRDPAERKALQRLKTQQEESHNRAGRSPENSLQDKLAALVKAIARQAAEDDFRAERKQNGRVQ